MKAVIFGIHGQDGYYLSQLLRGEQVQVVGVSRSHGDWVEGSVSDYAFVEFLLKKEQPDFIFHFAANSTTSHEALFENHESISTGTLNILEAVRVYCPKARVFISGSAMQFKNQGAPINEATAFDPSSPYSIARIHSVYASRYFRQVFGLKVYVGYFFNHDSPLRTERHINKKIAEAVKRIARGSSEKIEIGDIDVQKEFNFAGDVVEAVWKIVNQDKVFEAIIGSGEAHSIKEYIEACFYMVNLKWKDYVISKKDFVPEYKVLVCDPGLIRSIGWIPKTNFNQLVNLMMN